MKNRQVEELKELETFTYEVLDFARTKIAWLMDMDRKYRFLTVEDLEKAERFYLKSGLELERTDENNHSEQPNQTTKEKTEP